MSAVTTLAATVIAAAGAVALYRYAERRTRSLRKAIDELRGSAKRPAPGAIIDYERDPDSGVYKPKSKSQR